MGATIAVDRFFIRPDDNRIELQGADETGEVAAGAQTVGKQRA